jgi:hypothetical protein
LINIIQQILFSDFMIFAVTGVVVILISVWAYSLREGPGYVLGWLVGIFFILVLATLFPYVPPPPGSSSQNVAFTLTFGQIIFPSFLGFILGFGTLLVVKVGGYSDSRIQRALTVASLMSFTIVAAYIILRSSVSDRFGLAVFVLTFAIGALMNFIFSRSMSRSFTSRVGQ